MAKKNRSDSAADSGSGFRIVKGARAGKPKMVTVTFQLTELQDAHLTLACDQNEVSRAEVVKQAVYHCLEQLGMPFPDAGDEISEELREKLEAKRRNREERAERRAAGDSDEGDDE